MRNRPIITCKECGKESPHHAYRLCSTCYFRQYKPRVIVCKECGLEKPHQAKGLCGACYGRWLYANNPEKGIARTRAWQQRNPEKAKRTKRRTKICRECGKEKFHRAHGLCKNCYDLWWRAQNPEKVKANYYRSLPRQLANNRRRRAREAGVYDDLTAEQIMRMYTIGRCFYCGEPTNLTLDHFVPIHYEGNTTKANMVLACRKCNSEKHTKLPQEVLTQLRFEGIKERRMIYET